MYTIYNGVSGKAPKSYKLHGEWGIFENFCVKRNLAVCRVTFNLKLQKKKTMGKQDVLLAPPIILLGSSP